MIRRIAAFLGVSVIMGLAAPSAQAEGPVVVELYTSQGCSSCPPADALMEELVKRDDVIALALHVDYWDYLGWKDTMGSPAHTKRQKAYAHVAGSRSIYTPQMIVGGETHVIGHHPRQLEQAIANQRSQVVDLGLSLRQSGQTLTIRANQAANLPRNMTVLVMRFIPEYDVAIKRGENAGRTITYVNAVTAIEEVARWDGRSALDLSTRLRGGDRAAVIIQAPGPGRILAAALAP